MSEIDVIIVGAGHNGLVAASYLARAGRSVLVVEGRDAVGGASVTEELFPGFRFSSVAGGCGYLSPEVVADLKLESHGLEVVPADPVVFAPRPDGSRLCIWRDTARTVEEIRRFSEADARRYPDFVALMRRLADVVGGLMRITPPDIPEISFRDLLALRPLAGPVRRLGRQNVSELLRVLPMPVSDLLEEWFESDALKAAIAGSAVRDITWGPREAGTAYTLLYQWALSDGLFRSSGAVRGGMGSLAAALAVSARSFGVEIRTGARVRRIAISEDRATGVELEGGEEIHARAVVSSADPRTTFLELLDVTQLPQSFVRHVRNIKFRGSAARVHLALNGLPEFSALPGGDVAAHLCGAIQIAPSVDSIQRAYDHVKYGEASERPFLDVEIPTLLDPDLAPEGRHVLSITAKYAPYHLRGTSWEERRESFLEAVIDTLAEYAPKLRDVILHRAILTPVDLEARYGLPEGSGHHGEITLDQFFHMRPVPGYAQYATPVAGLWVCGAGAHPGGGITGVPGRNAARAILKRSR